MELKIVEDYNQFAIKLQDYMWTSILDTAAVEDESSFIEVLVPPAD